MADDSTDEVLFAEPLEAPSEYYDLSCEGGTKEAIFCSAATI